MLEGPGVILEGRVPVGLGKVPCIACLGEQGKVRQREAGRQLTVLEARAFGATRGQAGVDKCNDEADDQRDHREQDPITPCQGSAGELHGQLERA